ncbi:hypothetical protein HS088_TW14G00014 [Tripterygium wilfordii]|uniref:Lethal giant larvae (Lgl)-like C-terminal domain-containing protein n=1 Tax=Tripterygium wilfordii TaxID=458696 RepID=A0A7J7CP72_TRIWF|nr:uncharacterized protein LOC120015638 [Tripterygium wilfordii]KAF5735885.1 hypothetical protein HS088_TW14G00014 [Tripterygium wilfordii]
MFVKKLVEKASIKKPGGNADGLKSSEVEPRVAFHYGIPSGSTMFAYDSIQNILAISTLDGRIKLFGRDNTQALLHSQEALPSKFLQFIPNQGVLLNVTIKNHIEVWDIDKKVLTHVHVCKEDIISFMVMQNSLYMYAGDSGGKISVLKLEQQPWNLQPMKYSIPFSASRGNSSEVSAETAVVRILPQPTAESKRVLIIFRDGIISLWEIRENRSIYTAGGNLLRSLHQETRKVTSACWACPFGSKVAVGYSNGELFIWSIPTNSNRTAESESDSVQSSPIFKLNLGYKVEKIPISSLKWAYAEGNASRLYVMGTSDFASTNSLSTNSLQIVLLNEQIETRTIKVGLHLPEPCIDMAIISSSSEQSKHQQDSLLALGKSGKIYVYDDCMIEKYLLQSQSRSPPSLPKDVELKMPFTDSSITVAKFITDNPHMLSFGDEDYLSMIKRIPPLLPLETKQKDEAYLKSVQFSGFPRVKNLYITGHNDGAINFWDASYPFFYPILSLKQQSEDDLSLSGIAVTALYFDGNSLLVSGDQDGMVRIFRFKPEPYATENNFISFQGIMKKGNNHIIQSLKLVKVNGSVVSMNISHGSRNLAVGSDQGYVSVFDVKGSTLLYHRHIASEISTGIISLQFGTCNFHGFEKNILLVATKESSALALDSDNGNPLSASTVHPKNPSRAIFMQILDGNDTISRGSNTSTGRDLRKGNPVEDAMQRDSSLLLCSEKAVYVYSLNHAIQGVKKVHYKKKFHSSYCCWASTFYSTSSAGLILLFPTGKIEIRCLPELSLIKETSIRGSTYTTPEANSFSESSICSSWDGELIMVNRDQEILVVSVLHQRNSSFRLLDSASKVFRKDLVLPQEGLTPAPVVQKKKGLFSSIMKGSRAKHVPGVEIEDTRENIEELAVIFSTANFSNDADNDENTTVDYDESELNLDDIDLDDFGDKPKDQKMLAALNKKNLASKFQVLKVFKQTKKGSATVEQPDEKGSAVDQIKKKYGFPSSSESGVLKMAENKLHENLRKLQGISLKSSEMQDTAKSFSSMAKEVLRTAEHDKRSI